MAKKIVICCDGTNNSLQKDLTNVARISKIARDGGGQTVYYDAGVGAESKLRTRIGKWIDRKLGGAFGAGLLENVEQAYLRLVDEYEPGADIYLFGFSRGAYTVRVLAGLAENYGLLKREHRDRASAVLEKFQRLFPKEGSAEAKDEAKRKAYLDRTFGEAAAIRTQYSHHPVPVRFMGIWDTVSSLGWLHDPKKFPNTARMPQVTAIRHALALDERRAKFRTNRVRPHQGQDVQEIWFTGVHSDVGGGYPEAESGLAKVTLEWMLREAEHAGLSADPAAKQQHLQGRDETAAPHESLKGGWWAIEYFWLPHYTKGRVQYKGQGWRSVEAADPAHRSVERRIHRSLPPKNQNWPAGKNGPWVD
jgi:uncharacterized protein (DUF2235 family)